MKFVFIVIICALGLSLATCDTLTSQPANSGSANDPGSFKGDLNNLGGPARNAPGVGAAGG